MAAKAIPSAPSSSNAERQTPRSRRVSRSRSKATEGDSAESPARGVDVLTISIWLEGRLPADRGEREDDLARELCGQLRDVATRARGFDSEVDNRDLNEVATGGKRW